jgi:hypothetical protein
VHACGRAGDAGADARRTQIVKPEVVLASDDDALDAIARGVLGGRCILFLGAGVHYPPPSGSPFEYPEAQRPPLGSALSEALAAKCDFTDRFPKESPANLQRVALCFERRFGRPRLVRELEAAVDVGKEPSPALRMLAELDFPVVVTTNYDRLFERALGAEGKQPQLEVYRSDERAETNEPPITPDPRRPYFLKLHGDISTPESIVITDEDYIQFVMRMTDKEPQNPVAGGLRYYFKTMTTLFIGYSLLDYNLRLLFKTLRWKVDRAKVPDTFSIDPFPDPLILDIWYYERRLVTFVAQSVWEFAPRLLERVAELRAAR